MVKKGDIVYLWLNYQTGFYGWGEIAETPKVIIEPETRDSKGRKRQVVTVNRKKPFEPPITQQAMLKQRNLKNLIPYGYDDLYAIELRPGQANYINDFVRQYGLEPPVGSEIVDITVQDAKPQFLIKTLLTFKEKTDEGKLVQAINIPWFDIIDLLVKDPNAAYEIPPEKWEEIIAGDIIKQDLKKLL